MVLYSWESRSHLWASSLSSSPKWGDCFFEISPYFGSLHFKFDDTEEKVYFFACRGILTGFALHAKWGKHTEVLILCERGCMGWYTISLSIKEWLVVIEFDSSIQRNPRKPPNAWLSFCFKSSQSTGCTLYHPALCLTDLQKALTWSLDKI
jgi:hypothetical protein